MPRQLSLQFPIEVLDARSIAGDAELAVFEPLAARSVVNQPDLADLFWQIKEIGENCWHLHCGQEACPAAKGRDYPVTLPQSACDEPLLPLELLRPGNIASNCTRLVWLKLGATNSSQVGRGQRGGDLSIKVLSDIFIQLGIMTDGHNPDHVFRVENPEDDLVGPRFGVAYFVTVIFCTR